MKTNKSLPRSFILVASAMLWCALNLPAQTAPTITNQPVDQVVTNGGTAVFSVTAAGTGPFTYQWLFNGTNAGAFISPIIITVAGNGTYDYSGDGGMATNGSLANPNGVAVDSAGNLYIADQANSRIRKVDTNGVITTVAGSGTTGFAGDGGAATNAALTYPYAVAVDTTGNLFIADVSNFRIRKVDTNGIITTVAGNGTNSYSGDGGAATNATLIAPVGVAVDNSGNLYVSDSYSRIRKVDTNGIISTFAGNTNSGYFGDGGAATNALFNNPYGLAVDAVGNLFIADSSNQRIRKVDTNGVVTTVAGNGNVTFSGDGGAATNASFFDPYSVAVDAAGNLFIADQGNARVRKVDTNGIITTVAGNGVLGFSGDGGPATNAAVYDPYGVAVGSAGNLYIADYNSFRIREVFLYPASLSTLTIGNITANNLGSYSVIVSNSAGSVTSSVAALYMPPYIAMQPAPATQTVFLGSSVSFTPATGGSLPLSYQWTLNGTNLPAATNASYQIANAGLGDAGLYSLTVTNLYGGITSQNASLTVACISQQPTNQTMYNGGATSFGVLMSAPGPFTYQWQFNGTNLPSSGIITTLAGNGSSGYSGDGGLATNAAMNYPRGVAVDSAGNVFIADYNNNRVRKVGANGIITTVAGTGTYGFSGDGGPATSATLRYAAGVAVDSVGNLFIADYGNYRIRKVDTNGIITTVAGKGTSGFSGDGGAATNAYMTSPSGVAVDSAGNLYIADYNNYRVRKVGTNGIILTVAGTGTIGYSGDGGFAANASLNYPYGLAVDSAGNLFIADYGNHRIRKVGTNGIITTFAGNGSSGSSGDTGLATNAAISNPYGVAVDRAGNVFVADYNYGRIREVGTNGIINTIAGNGSVGYSGDGGRAKNAMLSSPRAMAVDSGGNLFIADNYRVRKVVGNPAYSPLLSTLVVDNLATNNAGNYSVVISNASGSITSAVASLTVTLPPVITVQPVSQSALVGSNPGFSTAVGGLGPFGYQWYFLNPGNQSPAGAEAQMVYGFTVLATVTNGGSGYVTVPNVQFVGCGGSGAGGFATVSNGVVVAITMTNAGYGYTAAPLVQIDPPSLLTGQTGPGLTFNSVTPGSAGNYMVTIANNYGSVTSQVASLSVLPCIVTVQPTNQMVGVGGSARFTVVAAGPGPLGYQWYFTGTNLVQSGVNSTLALSGVSTNDAGNYTVVVTNNYGSATSQVATLTVVLPPTVAILPASQTNLAGTTVSFSVAASGVGPFTYQWQFNGTNLPNNIITTVAGKSTPGYSGDGGVATNASLYRPTGFAFDSAGNLFIADQANNRIRKLDTNGIITTVAGKSSSGYSGDGGAATNASLNYPQNVGFDAAGNLYIAGYYDNRVRKVDASGIITTVAGNGATSYSGDGGWAISASLNHPTGVTFDTSGNMYISDCWNNRVRKVDANGIITTLAGKAAQGFSGDGGAATNASLNQPYAVAFDASGNMYIPDWQNNRIRKVATNGIITTVAGKNGNGFSGDGGMATNAYLNQPQGVAFDAAGNLFIADWQNHRIRKVATNGIITTVAGNGISGYSGDGGVATDASLNGPPCIVFDVTGNMFIADWQNNRVREVHFAGFPTLVLTNVSVTNAGNYSVVITSPYGSVTGAVATLTVIIPSTPPQIIVGGTNFGFTTNLANQSGFGFNLNGEYGQTIVVDGSTNLLDWMPLFTNTANGTPAYFFDPATTNFPGRFYRARLQ